MAMTPVPVDDIGLVLEETLLHFSLLNAGA